jgi:RNA polymerase sigma-70 factor (ECF subfamily)
VSKRSPPAFDVAELYKRFGPLVLRRGRRFLGDAEAEEVLHEVFLKALERGHEFRGESSPSTWLFRVTTHLCLNRRRDQKRRAELLERHGPTVWAEELRQRSGSESAEARTFLNKLWRTLPEELAMIGVLYWVDGLTTAEIGRMLGVSDRTVANRLTALQEAAKKAEGGP